MNKFLCIGVDALSRLKVLLDIASALVYLHSLDPRIVHCDLKPENVLIEQQRIMVLARLVDFGLSRLVTSNARHIGGTRLWMAPELRRSGTASVTKPVPSVDVFSFGLLTRFMATGRLPDVAGAPPAAPLGPKAVSGGSSRWFSSECHKIWVACTKQEPAWRPDMGNVQNALLASVPSGEDARRSLGGHVAMLMMLGSAWSAGRREIEDLLECKPVGQKQPMVGSGRSLIAL